MSPWTFVEWVAAFCICMAMILGVAVGFATLATWLEHKAETRGKMGGRLDR